MTTLAIDYGEKRIGLAVSDPMGIIASGAGTFGAGPDLIDRILALAAERNVGRIVVGLPLTLQGENGPVTTLVLAFVEALRARTELPVETFDERFTSSMATQTIRDLGVGRAKRRDKAKVDEIAAVHLLQGFLDRGANMRGR
ncbi:MAG: Holliday junction resolvase RuvX [Ignavibacteriae bacterium]|nr:Holliday junction resolvase RuvX [Ignavibacteriota bacterium]